MINEPKPFYIVEIEFPSGGRNKYRVLATSEFDAKLIALGKHLVDDAKVLSVVRVNASTSD